MSDRSPALELVDLRKTYRASKRQPEKEALKGVDLEVPRGIFFGLLGPNGAGKSTLINILAGLVTKTSGEVRICGIDPDRNPRRARRAIGVVPQELNLDAFFTPREVLEFQAGLYGVRKADRRTDDILARVGLADKADAYSRSLSGGMRRRLLVAKALVHGPDVVILDEPTAGVDVDLRRSLWAYMRELNAQGVTIILTTHYLEEAEALSDQIAIIDRGSVVCCDTKENLVNQVDEKLLRLDLAAELDAIPQALAKLGAEQTGPSELTLRYRPSQARIDELLVAVRDAGLVVRDLKTEEASLEDLFLKLTGQAEAA